LKAGKIRKCPHCMTYTLKEVCKVCGTKTVSPHPVHFTPASKHASLLLKARKAGADSRLFNDRGDFVERENGTRD